MATGDLIKLGTLYLGGAKLARPTNPVRGGDSHQFVRGRAIEIRNTELSDADQLQWIEVNDRGKKYLVSDRILIVDLTWSDLDAQSLVYGKEVTIDGQQYNLRSLTGGSSTRSGQYSGGLPTDNEWDRWIVNEANLAGLPKPTATELTENGANLTGAHNQFWNWYTMYSWVQEYYSGSSTSVVARGYFSAQYHRSYYYSSNKSLFLGWRPVLEVLWTPPDLAFNINGQLKEYENGWVKIDGQLRQIDKLWTKVNGILREV